ncbi:hypothetical protein D1007_00983 [Hordeum vulgare]|nr:hypothetical protein D1007_00983 [Hordeum vulgare]
MEILADLFGLCFKCFREGRHTDDCKFKLLCIQCGLEGHISSNIKRPRSPRSEEELRHEAVPKVARTFSPSVPAGLPRTLSSATRHVSPREGPLLVPVDIVPVGSGQATAPSMATRGICVSRWSSEMEYVERHLQPAVVAYVGGSQPVVSGVEAAEAIDVELRIPRQNFSVRKFHPKDFVVVFSSPEFRNMALAAGTDDHGRFKLFVWPWLRQTQAASRVMRAQIDLMIEGVPSHAWTRETAADLLGLSCLVESLAPETANREDLSLFKMRAWCVDLDDVSVDVRVWIREPEKTDEPVTPLPTSRLLLEYKTIIHI